MTNQELFFAIRLVREALDKIQAFARLSPPPSGWSDLIDASVALTRAMYLMGKEDQPEPPAKCDEREEPEVTTVKVAYGPQDGGYCSDGSTPKPHCTVAAFVGKHVYDAVVAELEAVRKDRAGLNGRLKAMMIQRMRWMNALGALEQMRQSFIVPELDQIEEEEQ